MTEFPSDRPVLVTCGLPYANGAAHIGHLRTYIPADMFVRTLRMMGQNTTFVCGSDTHGTPIVVNAEEQGTTPGELVKKYHLVFEQTFKNFEIDFNHYGSTDDLENHERTRSIVRDLEKNGYVYPKEIKVAYCGHCQRGLPDRYVEGTCPYCGALARGDECDIGCQKHLEPGDILDPRCRICGGKAETRVKEHFFFKLSEFGPFLTDYLNKLHATSNVNYAKEWAKDLKDWCITRNLEWGVKYPGHEDLVVYVWVDAPIGYIAFTEEYMSSIGEDWKNIWKGDSRIIHFIGGDIIYHHCIFWPAMLKGAGYTLPWGVVASGMIKVNDKKFSKSRGYIVWVEDDYLAHGFHPDLLRYYILSYTSHTKDINFSWKEFQTKVNKELVGSFGNFVNRVLTFIESKGLDVKGEIDPSVSEAIKTAMSVAKAEIENYEFKKICDSIITLADFGNTYFQGHEPWKLIKEDKAACENVLYNCTQIVKALAILSWPSIPAKAEEIWGMLGYDKASLSKVPLEDALLPYVSMDRPKPTILFSKLEDKKIAEMEKILNERVAAAEAKAAGFKEVPKVSIEEFQKIEIKIGRVISSERIKGSKKLLKSMIDVGEARPRQIVSGIAEQYSPEEMVGKTVVVITNLKPVKIMGVESNGMVMAADSNGATLLTPEKPSEPGTKVR
ncbi:methionyl-tRNA synthetase [Methanocella paludicola SANAE]|uniref:Methionine--tRNA ligase n=1 Tax=Methanocella paludicola (strain DSM 17711 / JCM 13418 / NBRC 101707 / SANAE) TaxID=304371 RepID=D1YWI6_METPS|nr:methionine--tRNA ligase [Methanocella paludicola]BAI60808.1 methionyl-tRNA synthetase [Methanocella paludicola SANAE]